MIILFGSKLKFFLSLIDELKSSNSSLKAEVSFLREVLEDVNDERKELSSLILKQTGFISQEVQQDSTQENLPIGKSVQSWASTRSKLEAKSKEAKRNIGSIIAKQEKELEKELSSEREENAS